MRSAAFSVHSPRPTPRLSLARRARTPSKPLTAVAPCRRVRRQPNKQTIMLAVAGAFSTTYTGLSASKLSQSRVAARSGCVEMKKASVGDLTEADLKGKKVRARPPAVLALATERRCGREVHGSQRAREPRSAGPGALRPERAA